MSLALLIDPSRESGTGVVFQRIRPILETCWETQRCRWFLKKGRLLPIGAPILLAIDAGERSLECRPRVWGDQWGVVIGQVLCRCRLEKLRRFDICSRSLRHTLHVSAKVYVIELYVDHVAGSDCCRSAARSGHCRCLPRPPFAARINSGLWQMAVPAAEARRQRNNPVNEQFCVLS